METSNNVINEEKKSLFTPKKIMRMLSLLCIVFVFCPAFLVSCSGQEIEVDVMTAVGGMSMYGETVVEPHPIMLICLLLPIVVLVVLFMKKFTAKKVSIISLICMAVDCIVWLVFKTSVKEIAEQNYCEVEVTGWFYLNMVTMLLIVILSFLVLIKVIQMDVNLVAMISGGGTQATINQMSAAVNQMTSAVNKLASNVVSTVGNKNEDRIGFCSKCGSGLTYGSRFCTSCGTEIPADILEEAEKKKEELVRKEAEEKARLEETENPSNENVNDKNAEKEKALFCQQCGVKLEEDAKFCEQCGAKVE